MARLLWYGDSRRGVTGEGVRKLGCVLGVSYIGDVVDGLKIEFTNMLIEV